MSTVLDAHRKAVAEATAARDARHAIPRAALEVMCIADLREYVADCARDHGAQCIMLGQCYTSPAWTRFRVALDVLSKRVAP